MITANFSRVSYDTFIEAIYRATKMLVHRSPKILADENSEASKIAISIIKEIENSENKPLLHIDANSADNYINILFQYISERNKSEFSDIDYIGEKTLDMLRKDNNLNVRNSGPI